MEVKLLLDEQTLKVLFEGKRIEGSLYAERVDNELVVGFNPYRRKKAYRRHDQTLLTLGHGWLRKSAKRYRLHLSIPDNLGERRVAGLMASETQQRGPTWWKPSCAASYREKISTPIYYY